MQNKFHMKWSFTKPPLYF